MGFNVGSFVIFVETEEGPESVSSPNVAGVALGFEDAGESLVFRGRERLCTRSSEKIEGLVFVVGFEDSLLVKEEGTLKIALRAAAAVEEDVDGQREEEEAAD